MSSLTEPPPRPAAIMAPTDTDEPSYYHRIVDCQWACPAHTPVPEYIRLIAQGRHGDAYLINWHSNLFPGVLGRTCDRPCEPACRRGRVDQAPVAICRLKRVCADHKGEIESRLPKPPFAPNGKRVACIGAGPATLSLARDLLPLGYDVTIYERDGFVGGMMRTQIPRFRLPESVLNEECGYVLALGPKMRLGEDVTSLKALLQEGYDAIFVGSGAPRGRELALPGRQEAASHVHVGIDWLATHHFGHGASVGERVIVLGGGNTAMDCCRTARRLGGREVKVIVRSGFAEMKASSWEKQDAIDEGVEILNFLAPLEFLHENGRLTGIRFERMRAEYDEAGRRKLLPTGEDHVTIPCDTALIAVGQENAYPFVERDIGIAFDAHDMPRLDSASLQSTHPSVFFGGDAAFGPKNIITAVAHGRIAAQSIHLRCQGRSPHQREAAQVTLISQKMGLHEWSYDNAISHQARHRVPRADDRLALTGLSIEVETGYDSDAALSEAGRCLNCDMQTVFEAPLCIECDACADICPMDCIAFAAPAPEADLRQCLSPPADDPSQPLFASPPLSSRRVLIKDENLCLHCGLCAERCPTGAWDMKKFSLAGMGA